MQLPPLKAMIVDDEPLASRIVRRFLEEEGDIEIVEECSNGQEALEAIKRLRPDLLFLDVQIPVVNGLEVLASLEPDEMPYVIFVTAYDEYALQAFEYHAVDYLLKPLDPERFKKAVRHVKEQIRQHQESKFFHQVTALLSQYRAEAIVEQAAEESYPSRLEIRSPGNVTFVDVGEIDWIEAADNYVVLHTTSGSYLMRESMSRLETMLDPQKFIRVHRSGIVNLSRVRELRTRRFGDRVVVLQDGTEVRVSRVQKDRLEQVLKSS